MAQDTFVPSRLTQARQRAGLTKEALAKKVGLTARRIAQFENEDSVPPEATMSALAAAVGFPAEFFMRSAAETVEPRRVSFRSFTTLSARDRDRAVAAASLAGELAEWIDLRFHLPEPSVPDLRDVGPTAAAAALRATWALGELPAPNMVHLMEFHGVRVFSLVDDVKSLDALSTWIAGKPFVFLTSHKSPERGRWDAAHELGHLVLHLGSAPQGREIEEDADVFAGALLLPEQGVRARAPRYFSLNDVIEQKLYWKVSALAYIRRIHQLGLVTDWQYKSLVIEASQRGYRRKEGDIDRESSQIIPKVLGMLRTEGVSLADLACDLAISPAELRGLVFSTVTAIGGTGQPVTGRASLRLVVPEA